MVKFDKKNIEDILSITPMQEGMLFHYLKDPGSDIYFEQLSLEIAGEIDFELFEKAWNFVIETNEMLRTVFRWEKIENPVQIILKNHQLQPKYYDLSGKESSEKKMRVENIKDEDRKEKFDLREVPFRVTLCRIEAEKYEMIISNHHILYDGWSNGIILKEFFDVYEALHKNTQELSSMAPTPIKTKFKRFLQGIQNRAVNEDTQFWEKYLEGFHKEKTFPGTRRKRREIKSTGNYQIKLPDDIKNILEGFVKSYNITIASFLYSVWGLLLQKYNSTNDVIFDTTVSGRRSKIKGIEDIVGLFINTLPLRVQTHPHEKISDFLSRTYRMLEQWGEFESSSLLNINEYFDEHYRESLFNSVVVIENYPLDRVLMHENSTLSVKSFSIFGMTHYDLTVLITEFADITLNFIYNKELFDEAIMVKLSDDILNIVRQIIENSQKEISKLTLLSEQVRDKILNRYNRMEIDHHVGDQEAEFMAAVNNEPPKDEVEKKLVDIWSGLFHVDKSAIGIDANFFDFGGHSLKASLLVGRIHKELKVKVPLAEVFRSPTIRQLSWYIREAGHAKHISIKVAEKKEYYAASSAQQRMYTLQQMEPESIAYNVSAFLMLEGRLEKEQVKILERSFQELINRHESQRTSIHVIGEESVQKIHEDVEFKVEYFDSTMKNAKGHEEVESIVHHFVRPFVLSRVPLLRIRLVKLTENTHLLMFDAHHIISDGTSMNVFVKEFIRVYSGKELPEPRIQYKDFSEWQRKQFMSEEIKKQESYWLKTFSGEIPVLNLPTDYPRSGGGTGRFEGSMLNFMVSQNLRQKLRSLERLKGATLYMILLAAYNVLLMKYSGQEDIIVGTLNDGRPHADLENVVGVLITTLVMRNRPRREKQFIDFLQEVKANCLRAFENSDYQFEELLKNIRSRRDTNRNPLFDTMFLLQNYEWTGLSLEGLVFKPYRFDTNASTFDLRITAVEVEEGIDIEIQYATRLFKETTIHRFAAHYLNILNEIGHNHRKSLGDIRVLTEREKEQILYEFNATRRNVGENKPVYQLFENQVVKSPDKTAVIYQNREIEYCALNEKANRLARLLKKRGIRTGQPVGILLSPTPLVEISIFATWKAGGAYIPIDPQYPIRRIKRVVTDSGARLMLSCTHTVKPEVEKEFKGSLLLLDRLEDEIEKENSENLELNTGLDSPAYIIYTSGSTGKPKGAGVYHRGFTNLMNWFVTEFGLNANDRNLLVTSLSFDLTQKNIFAPLITGGELTIPGLDYFEPGSILEIIGEKQVTWLNCTPSMIYKIIEFSTEEELKKLSFLKYLFLGGEPISMVRLRKWVESDYCGAEIVNTYGPTECTDICAAYPITEPGKYFENVIPIGKPIYNVRLYVLDTSYRPLPVGIPGELSIGGEGVGLGYINDIPMTSGKFITVSLHGDLPLHLYRTGDLVKWLPDGNIEFIGRVDHQVKIRGFRIELEEIESQLLTHDKIKAAVVLVLERKPQTMGQGAADRYLCAYIVSDEQMSAVQLKKYLSNQLPDYMIPSYFIQLDKIPLTPHGKVDRKQLSKPDAAGPDPGMAGEYVEPSTEIEKILTQLWKRILGVEKVGITDNFFELGGDSLLVIQVIARLREELRVELPVKVFFQHPFIEELSAEIEARERDVVCIPRTPSGVEIPLSFAQERLWFLHQLDHQNIAYFVPRAVRIKGKLDPSLVERTFNEIIRRHEILRTVFPTIDGRPIQRVLPHTPFKLPIIDLTHLEEGRQSQMVTRWLTGEVQHPFDFEEGPMIRITLLKLKSEEHLLVTTEHHLVHDGWTQGVLLGEFITIFTAYSEGKPSPLPGLTIQYGDYAYWQRKYMQGKKLENHLCYWKEKLSGLPSVLNLPTDRPRLPVVSGRGAEKRLFLSKQLSDALKTFSRERDVTLFMTMLAVFKVLLYRYTGSGDLCVGTGAANRRYKEMEGMLGMMINTLVLRTRISGKLSFEQCLQRVKTTCLEAYEHEDTPFEKVVEVIQPERSLSYTPIFQVLYSFMDTPAEQLQLPGLELHIEPAHNRSSKFDINIIVEPPMEQRMEETGGRIEIIWEYNTDILDDTTTERMLRHYNRLLQEIIINFSEKISVFPMMEQREIEQLLYDFNKTEAKYPQDKAIHQLFEEQVQKTPDNIALIGRGWHPQPIKEPGAQGAPGESYEECCVPDVRRCALTYRELNKKANRLAEVLKGKGVKNGSIAGLMVERSINLMAALLAILKTGGTYLPIDPGYPEERIKYMLKDSRSELLLTDNHRGLSEIIPVLDLNETETWKYNRKPLDPPVNSSASDPIYVIYTSGTTGKPKGILIEHRSVVNFIKGMTDVIPFIGKDVILSLTTISFDIFGLETILPLIKGSRVVIGSREEQLDVYLAAAVMERENTTIFQATPSRLQLMILDKEPAKSLKPLKYLLVGGEVFPGTLLEELGKLTDGKIYNVYGPAETTIWSTLKEVTGKKSLNIGKPITNTLIYILSRTSTLQPIGVPGELCISGDGAAKGYINRSELTAEKFAVNPFVKGERMYRTGDLARWLSDGNIGFLGRKDYQVKIRGFRIELGEIETQLQNHPDIKEAVVIIRESVKGNVGGGDKYLCAYIVYEKELAISTLREYISKELPGYMIPSYFMQLEKLPLTPNGKVDRKALPKPEAASKENYAAPRNQLEEILAEMWAELLISENEDSLHPSLGIDDNFFQLGGHSLKATLLVAKIHKAFNVRVPLAELFKAPTIRGLAQSIKTTARDRYIPIKRKEEKEYYPLSPAQKRLYILHQMDKTSTWYNIPTVLRLEGVVDKDRLEDAFKQLIERHDSLRTSFIMEEDEPVQRIHEENPKFQITNYKQCTCLKKRQVLNSKLQIKNIINEFIRPFDLSQAPLLRVELLHTLAFDHPSPTTPTTHQRKKPGSKYLLMVDMHHIVSDGMSMEIFATDFVTLYAGKQLLPLKLQYKDYVEWLNTEKEKKVQLKQAEYWQKQFQEEIPVLDLPTDFVRPQIQRFEGGRIKFEITSHDTHGLKTLALEEGTTLFIVLLGIYSILLSKLSNQETIIVGTPVVGRRHTDLEQIIGVFINTLGLKSFPRNYKVFKEYLKEINGETLKAFENQDYPFEELVEKVSVNRDAGRNPLFDVMFVFQNMDISRIEIPGLRLQPYEYERNTSKFDLTLQAFELNEKILFILEYSTALFKKLTVKKFVRYFKQIISAVIENPLKKIVDLEIISESDRNQILFDFNNTDDDYPRDKMIHQLFEEQVERTPAHVALVMHSAGRDAQGEKGRSALCDLRHAITYKELNKKSNQLACLLKQKDVQPDTIVGIMVERSIEMLIGILGILKAGGAYLPIDPEYPEDRINYMLADSKAKVLLAAPEAEVKVKAEVEERFIDIIDISNLFSSSTSTSRLAASAANLAYIIYTSGTTGKPKGTLITHRNVVRLLFNDRFQFDFNSSDTWTLFHSYCFDFSVWEMYGALLYGGKLRLIPRRTAVDTREFLEILARENVTVLNQTPSAFYNLSNLEVQKPGKHLYLKYVIFGGEALKPLKLKQWKNKYPETRLINMFGITETTVHVTYKEIEDRDIRLNISNIGQPIPTLSTYIMGRGQQLLPIGVTGEICVGGEGVGRGYLNRPELTSEKFIGHPYITGLQLYRSGDSGRLSENGDMEYLGRIDHQVKIRGYRIEPEEIENHLLMHPEIKEAVVLAKENENGDKTLCAYIVPVRKPRDTELREYLSGKLPTYMIPSHFVTMEKLPLTPSGKLDRKSLPEPILEAGPGYTAPGNEVERKLVEIWTDLLGIDIQHDVIGIDDNFFELGGHSLKANLLVSRIHKEFNIRLPLLDIFRSPTVKKLVECMTGLTREEYVSIEPVEKKEYYDLSSAQKRIYIMQQMKPGSIEFNMPGVFLLQGNLSRKKIEKVFAGLIQRHEILRTSFFPVNGHEAQKVHHTLDFKVKYYTCSEAEAIPKISQFIKPFDLNCAPLLRVKLIQIEKETYYIFLDMHHIITDGSSMGILVDEFSRLYKGKKLSPLPIQYKDYAAWQGNKLQVETLKQQEKYWLKKIEGFMFTRIPVDKFAAYKQVEGRRKSLKIEQPIYSKVEKFCHKHGITRFVFMLTVFEIILAREADQTDITIGTPVSIKNHLYLKDLIGIFLNILLIRSTINKTDMFLNALAKNKQVVTGALNNRYYPYEFLNLQIREKYNLKRDELFSVFFNYFPKEENLEIATDDFKIAALELTEVSPKYDMTLYVFDPGDFMKLDLVYKANIYDECTIESILDGIANVIGLVLKNENAIISALNPFDVEEDNFEPELEEYDEEEEFIF